MSNMWQNKRTAIIGTVMAAVALTALFVGIQSSSESTAPASGSGPQTSTTYHQNSAQTSQDTEKEPQSTSGENDGDD